MVELNVSFTSAHRVFPDLIKTDNSPWVNQLIRKAESEFPATNTVIELSYNPGTETVTMRVFDEVEKTIYSLNHIVSDEWTVRDMQDLEREFKWF